jgi:glutathione reductase (NADPH)
MLEKAGVELVRGFARFVGARTVEVDGERFSAPHIVIATGGRPLCPTCPGAELGIDSDGFFALEAQPRRIAIVGAGYIAVELAGVFNGLGSEVAMLVRGDRLLRPFDAMLRDELTAQMQEDGIALRFGTQARALRPPGRRQHRSIDCGTAARSRSTRWCGPPAAAQHRPPRSSPLPASRPTTRA